MKKQTLNLKEIISLNRFYPNAWLTLVKFHYIGECRCEWAKNGNLIKRKGKCLQLNSPK